MKYFTLIEGHVCSEFMLFLIAYLNDIIFKLLNIFNIHYLAWD